MLAMTLHVATFPWQPLDTRSRKLLHDHTQFQGLECIAPR